MPLRRAEESRYVSETAFQQAIRPQHDAVEEFENHPEAASLLQLVRRLGRLPLEQEFDAYEELLAAFGSRHRINRLLWKAIHPDLDEVRRQRREDLLIPRLRLL
jgi:hypothetical protein